MKANEAAKEKAAYEAIPLEERERMEELKRLKGLSHKSFSHGALRNEFGGLADEAGFPKHHINFQPGMKAHTHPRPKFVLKRTTEEEV